MLTLEALRSYGADVEEGLHRCMNMEAFYLKLFDSLKGDTRVEALKGIYGNLSLTPLFRPIQELTELLRARKDTDYSALLAEITAQKEKLDALL